MPTAEYQREWRKNNPEKVKASKERFRKKNPEYYIKYYTENLEKERERSRKKCLKIREERPFEILLMSAIKHAKDSDFECALTLEQLEEKFLIQRGYCGYTGLPLIFTLELRHALKPSLDRIDSSKGYDKDNVVFVPWCINALKGTRPIGEVFIILDAIRGVPSKLDRPEKPARDVYKTLLRSSKRNAKVKGLAFDLTLPWLLEQKEKQGNMCFYSKLPLVPAKEAFYPLKPSLDRIDPSKGYTKDNVVITCWCVNSMKSTRPVEEILMVFRMLQDGVRAYCPITLLH